MFCCCNIYLRYLGVGDHLNGTGLGVGQEKLSSFTCHIDTLVGGPGVSSENNRVLLLHEGVVRLFVEYVTEVGRRGESSD